MCHHGQCCRRPRCQCNAHIVIARRGLLAHIPQERLTNTVILSSVEERVYLELVSQLLRESNMTLIIKASMTKYQDRVFVLQFNQLYVQAYQHYFCFWWSRDISLA